VIEILGRHALQRFSGDWGSGNHAAIARVEVIDDAHLHVAEFRKQDVRLEFIIRCIYVVSARLFRSGCAKSVEQLDWKAVPGDEKGANIHMSSKDLANKFLFLRFEGLVTFNSEKLGQSGKRKRMH
jgi:hypothetical protein